MDDLAETSLALSRQSLADRVERRLDWLVTPYFRFVAVHQVGVARFRAIRLILFWVIGVALSAVFFVSAAIGLMIMASFYLSPDVTELSLPKGNLVGLAFLSLTGWVVWQVVRLFNGGVSNNIVSRVRKTWGGERRVIVWCAVTKDKEVHQDAAFQA